MKNVPESSFDGVSYIEVRTRGILPFDDFLTGESTDKLQVIMPTDASMVADFAFRGVYIDLKGSQKIETILTLKHLLYLYYQHIFGIGIYTIVENLGTADEKCFLINEYERVAMDYPLPRLRRGKNGRSVSFSTLPNKARLFPVKVWQKDEDALKDLTKVLGKFAPNKDYDKQEEEKVAELSLETGEIFEYFLSTARSHTPYSLSDVRSKLTEAGLESDVSDEKLQSQIDIVSVFLSNIIK